MLHFHMFWKQSLVLFEFFQVTLKGAKDCVEAARKRILEIVDDLDCQITIECVIEQVIFYYI